MRLSYELRSALRTIGNATIGVGLGMSVLVIAFVVSQYATGQGNVARSAATAAARTSIPLAVAATVSLLPRPAPTPTTAPLSPSPPAAGTDPASTSTPTPAPPPRTEALSVTAYASGGKHYAALRAPIGYVYLAPIAGAVQVRLYQLIDGEVRIGSNVPSLPFFPYVTLESADRRVVFRPGALSADTQLLVKDGEHAEPGTPLFKTVGDGNSSWRTFYDRGLTANVIASVAALPSGAELDPVAFLTPR